MNNAIETARKTNTDFYLPSNGVTCFRSLDATDVAAWLRAEGYEVVSNIDTGRNGLATTRCGVAVSSNGHVSFI